MTYDTVIRNDRWFDGTGAPSAIRNIGIHDGHVEAVSPQDLDESGCRQVIDATGKWVLPGLLDIHTHYDSAPEVSRVLRLLLRLRKASWPMPVDNSVTGAVLGLWRALSRRDLGCGQDVLVGGLIYVDVPVGATLAARGPDDIVQRPKVGLQPLAEYQNHGGQMVSNGADVMYEHSETWRWATGETTVLQFVSVHLAADGTVTLWKECCAANWCRWPEKPPVADDRCPRNICDLRGVSVARVSDDHARTERIGRRRHLRHRPAPRRQGL